MTRFPRPMIALAIVAMAAGCATAGAQGATPSTAGGITVGGDMPAHGHGMPTQPEVTADLGGGDYRVEGMAFQRLLDRGRDRDR